MIMTLDALMESIPSYAKDLKLSFSSVVRQQTELTEQQLWGTVVACAMASRSEELTAAAIEEASAHLSSQALAAAEGASAIMGMNNVFYRFLHLSSNEKYATMRAGLRMTSFAAMASICSILSCGASQFRLSMAAGPVSTRTRRCLARRGSAKRRFWLPFALLRCCMQSQWCSIPSEWRQVSRLPDAPSCGSIRAGLEHGIKNGGQR